MLTAQVIVELSLDKKFDYLVPPELAQAVQPGVRVEVPFGRSTRVGCVLSVREADEIKSSFTLKEIIIKEQHNCQATGYWKTNSIKHNFLLLAHEYLFIFKKV